MYVPASIRSAMIAWSTGWSASWPWIVIVVGAGAFDVRAHLVEDAGQLLDLRLAGRVHQGGPALGQHRGAHQVLGAGDGRHVEPDVGAAQPPARHLDVDIAVFERDRGAHRLEPLEVLIDRPGADRAAARERHAGAAVAGDERAEHQHRSAHLADQLVGRVRLLDRPANHPHHRRIDLRVEPEMAEQLGGGPDVPSGRARCGTCSPRRPGATRTRIGSAAFFAPLMRTVPRSGLPPTTRKLSTRPQYPGARNRTTTPKGGSRGNTPHSRDGDRLSARDPGHSSTSV